MDTLARRADFSESPKRTTNTDNKIPSFLGIAAGVGLSILAVGGVSLCLPLAILGGTILCVALLASLTAAVQKYYADDRPIRTARSDTKHALETTQKQKQYAHRWSQKATQYCHRVNYLGKQIEILNAQMTAQAHDIATLSVQEMKEKARDLQAHTHQQNMSEDAKQKAQQAQQKKPRTQEKNKMRAEEAHRTALLAQASSQEQNKRMMAAIHATADAKQRYEEHRHKRSVLCQELGALCRKIICCADRAEQSAQQAQQYYGKTTQSAEELAQLIGTGVQEHHSEAIITEAQHAAQQAQHDAAQAKHSKRKSIQLKMLITQRIDEEEGWEQTTQQRLKQEIADSRQEVENDLRMIYTHIEKAAEIVETAGNIVLHAEYQAMGGETITTPLSASVELEVKMATLMKEHTNCVQSIASQIQELQYLVSQQSTSHERETTKNELQLIHCRLLNTNNTMREYVNAMQTSTLALMNLKSKQPQIDTTQLLTISHQFLGLHSNSVVE